MEVIREDLCAVWQEAICLPSEWEPDVMGETPIKLKSKYLVPGGLRHGFKTPSHGGAGASKHKNKDGEGRVKSVDRNIGVRERIRVMLPGGRCYLAWRPYVET